MRIFSLSFLSALGLVFGCGAEISSVSLPVEPPPIFEIPKALDRIETTIARLGGEIEPLPRLSEPLQFDAYGYHGGYLPALSVLPEEPRWTVDLQFSKYAHFDQIILVPAIDRSADPIRSYGFPERFRVFQVFSNGRRSLVKEWMHEDCPDPGRIPIILDIQGNKASRLMIEVFRGCVEREKEFFALDEVFGMVEGWAWRARTIEVSSELESLPYWGKDFLIDRRTSLGLPVGLSVADERDEHDFSVVLDLSANEKPCLEVDLGEQGYWVGDITLFPATPSDGFLIPGYGFPGKIEVSRQMGSRVGARKGIAKVSAKWRGGNPGNNMIRIPVNSHGRWFRLIFSDLPLHDGEAVLAFGEIQFQKPNVAYPIKAIKLIGFPESAELQVDRLTDGKVSGRPTMHMLDWMRQIVKRSQLEHELNQLSDTKEALVVRWKWFWRNSAVAGGLVLFTIAVGLAVFALIQRYRLHRRFEQEHHRTELQQMKIRFFTHISHELRTPLTVISGPLEKVLATNRDPDQREYLNLAHRNVKKLQCLVDQLLDFRKLQEGRASLKWGVVNISQYIRNGFNSYQSMAVDKNIDYRLSVPDADCRLAIDSGKFQRILDNLISNAIKYTAEGGRVQVGLSVERGADELPVGIQFSVEDTGVGIASDDLAHVFEQFYRAEGLEPIQASGSGIGLALVKELVDLWGGKISVESPVIDGHGTRFAVCLPVKGDEAGTEGCNADLERQDAAPVIEPKDPEIASVESPIVNLESAPVILLVEDNEDVRSFVRMELENMYRVVEAKNGREGLRAAEEAVPDLIVSDVMMPEMSGIDFCRRVKTDELTSHIPVVLLTARGSQEHQLEGLETGADDYLIKPFSVPLLKARIHNLLESRRVLRERFARDLSVEPSAITVTSADAQLLQRAIDMVEKHMSDASFSVEQFAAEMHMARNTLLLKLRALVDQSPRDFIRTLRLKRARQLLEQGGGTISEIAFQVGFEEPTHFSRSFKKQFEQTPSAFLKSIKSSD